MPYDKKLRRDDDVRATNNTTARPKTKVIYHMLRLESCNNFLMRFIRDFSANLHELGRILDKFFFSLIFYSDVKKKEKKNR